MKYALSFAAGMLCGAIAMVSALAWPELKRPNDDAFAIQAFRDMGCQPYITKDGALISGCDKIVKIEVTNGRN